MITETAPPPGGTPVATYTFSDGGLDGWAPFGSATLTNAAPPIPDPNGDTHSLLTTNRTATYMGPSLNLLSVPNVVAGATYQVTAYVLLAAPDSSQPDGDDLDQDCGLRDNRIVMAILRPPARSPAPRGPRCKAHSASAICPVRLPA